MTKENLENVGGSLAEGFEVGEDVFVGKNSTPAKIVKLLSDGYVKIEWPKSEGTEWESEYHVDKLQKLGARRRKQSALGERPDGEQQEAPTKKIKKETKQENSSIKESLLPSLSTSVNESDGTCSSSYASSAKSSVKPEPKQTKVSTVKRKTKPKPAVPDLWQVSGVDKDQGLKEIKGLLPKGLKRCAQEVVHFFLFCYERQMVWERRNLGEPEPYSESKTMQEYLFCNVSCYLCVQFGACFLRMLRSCLHHLFHAFVVSSFIAELSRARPRNQLLSSSDIGSLGQVQWGRTH